VCTWHGKPQSRGAVVGACVNGRKVTADADELPGTRAAGQTILRPIDLRPDRPCAGPIRRLVDPAPSSIFRLHSIFASPRAVVSRHYDRTMALGNTLLGNTRSGQQMFAEPDYFP
jgi:hypothetical protein